MKTKISKRSAVAVAAAALHVSAIAPSIPCSSAFIFPTASTSSRTCIAPRPSSLSTTTLYIDNFMNKFNQAEPKDDMDKNQEKNEGEDVSTQVLEHSTPLPTEDLESYVNAVKANILSGDFGERGEQYVIAQFGLLLCIALGFVPYFGDIISLTLGPGLIGASLVIVYKAAADLGKNLSPWPVPADPNSDSGSLIDSGIYSYMRHPMYSGLVFGMAGLSIATDSAMRLLLTAALYIVLDAKADFEETKLMQTYGDGYVEYMYSVKGKLIPDAVLSLGKGVEAKDEKESIGEEDQ